VTTAQEDGGPQWFRDALAIAPERGAVEVEGAAIETLAWGRRGRPGLLLVHGAGAHADWWSFIAPLLAEDYRVAAFSLSGMGGSAWRERYSLDLYAREAFAVATATGLFDGDEPPVFAAHSFGGRTALRCAAGPRSGELKAAVVIDSLVRPPDAAPGARPFRRGNARVYPTEEAILARFRLTPSQPVLHPALLDHVARRSIRPTVDEAGRPGWTWRFDPALWDKLDDGPTVFDLRAARCPVAAVRGARSVLVTPELTEYFRANAPAGSPVVVVPEARHHVMLDQPLALVAALRGLLAGWPERRRPG
jgi:pimeloyl-ACP methyl ester carboxylesterase